MRSPVLRSIAAHTACRHAPRGRGEGLGALAGHVKELSCAMGQARGARLGERMRAGAFRSYGRHARARRRERGSPGRPMT
eukprot:3549251-Prymnesium_polylepis.1